MTADRNREPNNRLGGLRRFAIAITVLNILGHTVLGFEQSWLQPFVALATGYSTEILLELVQAWSKRRPPQFMGGYTKFVDFLLPAHISGLAVAMLIYANERLWPVAFATAAAIGS
ncbi:MAG: enediyne biosynthesis protein UnbU, partial [Acidobacteria bacterium]|nr:enediyne biosynthesis protein UnbU [Acidobacteriota bacterium]